MSAIVCRWNVRRFRTNVRTTARRFLFNSAPPLLKLASSSVCVSRDSPSPTDSPTSRLMLANTDRCRPLTLPWSDIRPRRLAPRTVRPSTDGPKAARKRGASAETATLAAMRSATSVCLRQSISRRRRLDCCAGGVETSSSSTEQFRRAASDSV